MNLIITTASEQSVFIVYTAFHSSVHNVQKLHSAEALSVISNQNILYVLSMTSATGKPNNIQPEATLRFIFFNFFNDAVNGSDCAA
jgi:hydrogenase-4 membrane subunit HyfE